MHEWGEAMHKPERKEPPPDALTAWNLSEKEIDICDKM
jgi:hypothetical protein